jgi:glycosyltransferase involved in cell wall biosynthesis
MIILNMIVKDEAHCIERCIKSVLPYIDAAVIVDTGSTDKTRKVISGLLWNSGIQWNICRQDWVNFGYNRTQAFWLAVDRWKEGYAFIMDADEEFLPEPAFQMPKDLDRAGYAIWQAQGSLRQLHPRLLNLSKPWVFQGAMHEYAELLDPDPTRGWIENCTITGHFDSARNKDKRAKYEADALVLESMVETPRNVFYKAQSYHGAGHHLMALQLYQKRVTMGGFEEETYIAWLRIAQLEQLTGARPSVIARAYEAAYRFRPSRAEAPYYLAKFCKERGHRSADFWFNVASQIPMTSDQLLVDMTAYSANHCSVV